MQNVGRASAKMAFVSRQAQILDARKTRIAAVYCVVIRGSVCHVSKSAIPLCATPCVAAKSAMEKAGAAKEKNVVVPKITRNLPRMENVDANRASPGQRLSQQMIFVVNRRGLHHANSTVCGLPTTRLAVAKNAMLWASVVQGKAVVRRAITLTLGAMVAVSARRVMSG
jgi:hypothetical protein